LPKDIPMIYYDEFTKRVQKLLASFTIVSVGINVENYIGNTFPLYTFIVDRPFRGRGGGGSTEQYTSFSLRKICVTINNNKLQKSFLTESSEAGHPMYIQYENITRINPLTANLRFCRS